MNTDTAAYLQPTNPATHNTPTTADAPQHPSESTGSFTSSTDGRMRFGQFIDAVPRCERLESALRNINRVAAQTLCDIEPELRDSIEGDERTLKTLSLATSLNDVADVLRILLKNARKLYPERE